MSLISAPVFSKRLCVIVHLRNTYEVISQSALDLLSSCLPGNKRVQPRSVSRALSPLPSKEQIGKFVRSHLVFAGA